MDYGPVIKTVRIEPPVPARKFVEHLQFLLQMHEHTKKPDENVRMFYASGFGILRAVRISSVENEFIQLTVMDGNGKTSEIVAHVSQASLRFEVFSPQTEAERKEKVLLGFSALKETRP